MMSQSHPKKILLTAGRSNITLDLARKFHQAGHKVYVVETSNQHLCYFSNAVHKTFLVPVPRFEPEKYISKLIEIVAEEQIDLLVPIYEEIMYIAKAKERFPSFCKVFCTSFPLLKQLHNKWIFTRMLHSLDIPTPRTYLIREQEDLGNLDSSLGYALKACYSRASLSLIKMQPGCRPPVISIDTSNPWIAQEWIEGNRYCSYSICQEGQVLAHALYPVRFAIGGNSCITFKSLHHAGIFAWIVDLVRRLHFTGQIAFDFIERDQTLFAIECNPRATCGFHLFKDQDDVEKAFFDYRGAPIFSNEDSSAQIVTGMCLYGWKSSSYPNNTFLTFLGELLKTPDVVFDRHDLIPFFAQPFVFSAIWKTSRKYTISIPAAFTFDHEWNGDDEASSGPEASNEPAREFPYLSESSNAVKAMADQS